VNSSYDGNEVLEWFEHCIGKIYSASNGITLTGRDKACLVPTTSQRVFCGNRIEIITYPPFSKVLKGGIIILYHFTTTGSATAVTGIVVVLLFFGG